MDKIKQLDIGAVWSNLASSAQSVSSIASSVEDFLETEKGEIRELVSSLESASRSIKDLAEELRNDPSLLLKGRENGPLPETARE